MAGTGKTIYMSRAMLMSLVKISGKFHDKASNSELIEAALSYTSGRIENMKAKIRVLKVGDEEFYDVIDVEPPKYITAEIAPDELAQIPAGDAVIPISELAHPPASPNTFQFVIDSDGKDGLEGIKFNNQERTDTEIINQALAFAYSEGIVFKKFMEA